MAEDDQRSEDVRSCPNCGEAVVYRGVGRRPVWCSTRCRNDAALRRLGARRGAIEVRVVNVLSHAPAPDGVPTTPTRQQPDNADSDTRKAAPPSPAQALRAIRNDPVAVGSLLSHLERRRSDGTLLAPEWLPVRNAIRLIASALPEGIERPT
jgi:hypothetical protein